MLDFAIEDAISAGFGQVCFVIRKDIEEAFRAEVSQKHAGFIINKNNATASDVLALIKLVSETVYAQTGVRLEPEVRIIGAEG